MSLAAAPVQQRAPPLYEQVEEFLERRWELTNVKPTVFICGNAATDAGMREHLKRSPHAASVTFLTNCDDGKVSYSAVKGRRVVIKIAVVTVNGTRSTVEGTEFWSLGRRDFHAQFGGGRLTAITYDNLSYNGT
jgi:hypothetical protein